MSKTKMVNFQIPDGSTDISLEKLMLSDSNDQNHYDVFHLCLATNNNNKFVVQINLYTFFLQNGIHI